MRSFQKGYTVYLLSKILILYNQLDNKLKFNKLFTLLSTQCVVKMRDCAVEIWDPNESPSLSKNFTFDSVYDQNSTTEAIYNDICYPLVEVSLI